MQDVVDCPGLLCKCVKMDEAIRIAKRVPELRKLTVQCMDRRKISKLCEYCPNITHLEFYINIRPSYTLLEDVFERCRKIKHLSLAFRVLANPEHAELVSRLEHLSCLRVVADAGLEGRYERQGQVQLRILADGCPRLEEIHFIWNFKDEAEKEHIRDTAGDWDLCMHALMNLFCHKFAMEELEYFLEAKRSSLTSVTLPWMIGPMRCVVPLLKQCNTNLKKLQLTRFYVPAALQSKAFEALGELHGLQELSTPYVSPSQPQLFSLPFQPGRLIQLRRLQLHDCNLSDETVVAISRGCPSLCELRITFSYKITDTALTDIGRLKCLKMPGRLIQLRRLQLHDCNLSDETVVAISRGCPSLCELRITFSYKITAQH